MAPLVNKQLIVILRHVDFMMHLLLLLLLFNQYFDILQSIGPSILLVDYF